MRILLVTPSFPPQRAVASLRTHSFAQTWGEAGHAVTVLTTQKRADQAGWEMTRDSFQVAELDYGVPWYLERMRAGYKAEQKEDAAPRRNWRSLLLWLKQKTGIFSSARMPDLTDYWIAPALAWARAHGPWDVVVSSYGPYAAHLVARAVKRERLAGCWVADYRDLWTENHLYRGMFPFTLKEAREERACLREVDLVVTVSQGLADKLKAKTSKPVEIILNGFDPAAHVRLAPESAFPADGKRRIVYTGTLYPQGQNPRPFLEALSLLERDTPALRERLSLVLAGPSAAVWREMLTAHPLACVDVRDFIPRELALRLQRDANALLLVDWRDPGEGVMTGKVFEYLTAAAPIFLVGSPAASPLAEFVRRTGRGVVVSDDPPRTAAWLARWLADPDTICTEPDRAFIADFSRERLALRFLDMLTRAWQKNQLPLAA